MFKKLLMFIVLTIGCGLAQGQVVVHFSLDVKQKQAWGGESIEAYLRAEIEPGWHLYSLTQPPGGPVPTSIVVPKNPVFSQAGRLIQPTFERVYDPNFGIETEFFSDEAIFVVPVAVSDRVAAGKHVLPVEVTYMVCDDSSCLPPQTETLTTVLEVMGTRAGSLPSPAQQTGTDSPQVTIGDAEVKGGPGTSVRPAEVANGQDTSAGSARLSSRPVAGSWSSGSSGSVLGYVWFAVVMGALALLTPCVFPMIPITVSYFTKREDRTKRRVIGEAGLYCLGIVLCFTLLGFLLTFLFGAGGINRMAASPLVNLLIAVVFIVFALSLFETIAIRVPSNWISAVDRKSRQTGGTIGILLMSLTFALTSFTCTVPFVGTVMVAATRGDWLWSLLGITAFATSFSAPFFLLAVFPSWLKALPKSGNWMGSLKIVMGFLELMAALKFLSNIDLVYQWQLLTRPAFLTIWTALALAAALYLFKCFRLPHERSSSTVGIGRMSAGIFFLAVSLWLARGLLGMNLGELDAFLPPADYGNSTVRTGSMTPQESAESLWLTNYEEALEKARLENKPVFIDFTGYTCTNCRWMETNVFTLPEVRAALSRYILVRLYTDGTLPEHSRNREMEEKRFGTIALPYYSILSAEDQVLGVFPGLTRDRKEFLAFLRSPWVS